jgi:YesN/AraC family two-component response regulator
MTSDLSPARRKLRVLIADDAQSTRRGTRLMLSLNNRVQVVAIVQDGAQAVEAIRQARVDVALMDINMPELDGISAIQQMLALQPSLYCIMVSAERASSTLRAAMAAGARDYLIKPYTSEELDAAIERADKVVSETRQKAAEESQIRRQRDSYAIKLATEYAKAHRRDDAAVQVFEYLASNPKCEARWLKHLAMMYVLRGDWGKLRDLAARLAGAPPSA